MFLLLLTIPPPAASMRWAEVALQHASADVSYVILKLTGTPVFRHGLVFSLPGMDIEVARECSGIRSTTALLITAILAGHLLLRASWSKACLVLLAIPVSIFKNAVRIATLSWLGVYVNPEVLHGELHRYGGLPFTLLALGLLVPLLLGLMRLEERWLKGQTAVSGPA
jgi:exosortase